MGGVAYSPPAVAETTDGCLPKATLPLPTCVEPQSPQERARIRSLADGEASLRSIHDASDAAASAVFELAEIHWRNTVKPCPVFTGAEGKAPFSDLKPSQLTAKQKAEQARWRANRREELQHYLQEQVRPWAEQAFYAIVDAERRYTSGSTN